MLLEVFIRGSRSTSHLSLTREVSEATLLQELLLLTSSGCAALLLPLNPKCCKTALGFHFSASDSSLS